MYIYWILLFVFVSIAAISTVSVGMSKKRANAEYFQGTKRKIMTLASAYAVITVLLTAIIYFVYLITK